MPVTISLYNHTVFRFVSGADSVSDTYKAKLLTAATFNASHTTLAQTGGTEVADGFGYLAGGAVAPSPNFALVAPNDARFDLGDVEWPAVGGSIIARYAILYNATDADNPPVAFIDFGEFETAEDGGAFRLVWDPSGLITFTTA